MVAGNIRVLVLDDSRTTRDMVTMSLNANGYFVTAISNPLEINKAMSLIDPDIALIDISMCSVDGPEIISSLRRHGLCRTTQLILHSSQEECVIQEKAAACGADRVETTQFPAQYIRIERSAGFHLFRVRSHDRRPPYSVRGGNPSSRRSEFSETVEFENRPNPTARASPASAGTVLPSAQCSACTSS